MNKTPGPAHGSSHSGERAEEWEYICRALLGRGQWQPSEACISGGPCAHTGHAGRALRLAALL